MHALDAESYMDYKLCSYQIIFGHSCAFFSFCSRLRCFERIGWSLLHNSAFNLADHFRQHFYDDIPPPLEEPPDETMYQHQHEPEREPTTTEDYSQFLQKAPPFLHAADPHDIVELALSLVNDREYQHAEVSQSFRAKPTTADEAR